MPRPRHKLRLIAMCMVLGWQPFIATAAQADSAAPHLEFDFTPYLWISGVVGTTSARNPNIPSQTSTASFGDLFTHLNSIPLIGAFEARYGRFGVLTDLMVISLKSDVQTKGAAFSGGSASVTELLYTLLPTYRVLETGDQSLDLGAGVRVMAFWTKFSVNAGVLPGFSTSPSLSWAAPIAGLRYHLNLPRRFGLTVYGDVGGLGGDANLTWQALGTVDYRYNDWLVLHLGYRHLQIDYNGNTLHTNTALSGPIFGTTIRF